MPASAAQPVNIICPEGDLLLRVTWKGNESLLLVCSQVMTRASGSFLRLLQLRRRPITQPFAFAPPMNELRIPEDDGDAMLTICNILHGRHQDVASALTLDALKNIASSCNRHQLTSVLSTWSLKWLKLALGKAANNEIYTVVAIAVDLGVSPTLVMHDTHWSQNFGRHDYLDKDLAGRTMLISSGLVSCAKLTRVYRWLPLPTDTGHA